MQCSERIFCNSISLRSRPLEVVGARKNGRARGKHARGEGVPTRKAMATKIVSTHSVIANIPIGLEAPEEKN